MCGSQGLQAPPQWYGSQGPHGMGASNFQFFSESSCVSKVFPLGCTSYGWAPQKIKKINENL